MKIRGTAHHVAEKYLQLARDAQTSGDPVTAENHFQHAEHYLRLIAVAQDQFRQQNPFYQAPPAPGEGNRDDAFDGDDEDSGQTSQPMQGQPMQGQPTQGQPPQGQQNYGNQQPSYPPREQPQPYNNSGNGNHSQQPQQSRPQHQPQPQQYQQPQPVVTEAGDAGQLPSFITGSQPQPGPQAFGQNGPNGDNQGGDRFPRHRRRRHRTPGAPRPDLPNAPQDFRGDDGADSPGNS